MEKIKKFLLENKKVIFIWIFWLVIINLFGLIGLNRFNLAPDNAYKWMNPREVFQTQTWNVVDLHAHWDSVHYLNIAKDGYSFKDIYTLSNVVFFPVLPFLMKVFSFIFANNYLLSGWFVSSVALLIALLIFFKYNKKFHPELDPYLPLILLLCFPFAFFLNAIYTESIFLVFSLAAFYFIRKKNFWLAGLFVMLASLTRVTGVLLFVPMLWEFLSENKFKLKKIFVPEILSLLGAPIGLGSFFLYHYIKFGDFFLFLKAESWFGRNFSLNSEHFELFSRPASVNFYLDVFFIIFAFICTIFVFKKFRPSYGFFMLANLFVALSTGTMMSIGRYVMILFPIFLLGASIKDQTYRIGWILSSVLLLALYTIAFVSNYWAG